MKQRLSISMCSCVERAVADQHARDQIAIAIDEALDREADLLLGEAAHLEQARLELFELLLKVPDARLGATPSSRTSRSRSLRSASRDGRGEDLVGPVALDQLAEPEEGRHVGDARRLLHVVRDDDDRVAALELVDQLLDALRRDRVERRRRFVHQQDLGLDGQRARDAQPLLLAAGERQRRRRAADP